MAQITGKTVYVLGAGASHHTGAPLLKDFLVRARLLREGRGELKYKESFDKVFEWIDRLRGSSYYVEFDLDNLEHIFSIAEMSSQLGLEEGKEISRHLTKVILETLDRCQLKYQDKQLRPDDIYLGFTQVLTKQNQKRMEYTNQARGTFENDVIVTFNYDVMLDYAMRFEGIVPEYCLASESNLNKFKILKLHGSTNWARCVDCKDSSGNDPQLVEASPVPKGYSLDPFTGDGTEVEFKMTTHVLPKTPCKSCNKIEVLEPIMIPPTWSKIVRDTPIANVWAQAVKEIKNAFQIVVIGYSVPPTDTFFQYLLTLGLASNPRLHRVVVVNKDDSDELKLRYEKIFARSLKDRGRLKFMTGTTFEDFVQKPGFMENIGSNIE